MVLPQAYDSENKTKEPQHLSHGISRQVQLRLIVILMVKILDF
jgi:hypothetical protein